MHSENFRRRALLVPLVLLAAAGASAASLLGSGRVEKVGSLYTVDEAGYLYTFDAAWRTESLLVDDDGDGIRTRVTDGDASRLHRMRTALLRDLKVENLDAIPAEGAEELDAIRALGYI